MTNLSHILNSPDYHGKIAYINLNHTATEQDQSVQDQDYSVLFSLEIISVPSLCQYHVTGNITCTDYNHVYYTNATVQWREVQHTDKSHFNTTLAIWMNQITVATGRRLPR